MKTKTTTQTNGYRWMISQDFYREGRWKAVSQKRCTMDSGRVYYRYGTSYEFDTEQDARDFVSTEPAKDWF